ncbi:lysine-specific demethylase JMJ26-like [Bidens hawaiensis]|uniref:lysine-specific demethylase JMJ26-like n=1 Tax=Bidens hawaiensis TaxID=980011 RepID=UPI00404950B0
MQGYAACSELDRIKYSKQIIQKVFPIVTRLNEDQLMEKEIEAKVKGVSISKLQLPDAACDIDDDIFCDNCGSYSFDFYRSCTCGYDLCLVCCRELRDGQLNGITCGWKARADGSVPCPPKGCNDGTLELKRIMSVNWIANLLEKTQRVYKVDNTSDDNSRTCSESNMRNLCALSAMNIKPQHMQHFQFHWSKGEPIIVNDVLSTSSKVSWEPMVLWRACNRPHAYEVKAINCLDWSEVTLSLNKFCRGYSAGQYTRHGLPLILKLEDWQPSFLSKGEWPGHFVELMNCLPFKDYTNSHNGYLDLAAKLPDLSSKPNMGPKTDIAYGVEEELEYGNSVTKLHYDKSDTVNVMTHTKSGVLASTKLNMVKQEHGDQNEAGRQRNDTLEWSALWDIFKRQDAPKLEEYLRNHSAEFTHTALLSDEHILHPIHDRTFYLHDEHKRKLKEEFGIEPWTFKQKLGDAVFIPAGCPYQVRNLKSNTKVELNFISPESLGECIRLQKELRMLPNYHKAKQQKLNVKYPAAGDGMDTNTSEEPIGVWKGNGLQQKRLQAVNHRYPDTFKGLQIRSKPYWLSLLKELHAFIRGFLATSVDALAEDQITSLEVDLNDFEGFGFNLSWARKRLDMVKNLKFGNDPLRPELMALEESFKLGYKELVEANERLETAWLNYNTAKDARNKKVNEAVQKFGAEYDDVLSHNLGFGMLPGY